MGGDKGKGKGGAGGGSKGGKRYANVYDLPFCFKVLCPEELVGSLMGNGGRTKDDIQEETGAKLRVSQRNEYFPTTQFRILSVFHDRHDGIIDALMRVVDRIVECGETERKKFASDVGKSDLDFLGKGRGEYAFRSAVSTKMCSAIIGPKGTKVQEVRKTCSARVSIDTAVHENHQILTVVAHPDGIRAALEMINPSVQEESGSPWFSEWASCVFPSADETWRDVRRPAERERTPRRASGGWGEEVESTGGSNGQNDVDQSMMQALAETVHGLPPGTMATEYGLTCDLPREKVSLLIGKGGDNVKEIRRLTRTKIHFEDAVENGQQRLSLQGSLLDVYRAHALMMKRYHETELPAPAAAASEPDVASIQAQLEELQKQLASVKQAKAGGRGKLRV